MEISYLFRNGKTVDRATASVTGALYPSSVGMTERHGDPLTQTERLERCVLTGGGERTEYTVRG